MAAGDLTTRAAVRSFLQKPAADVEQDAEIDRLITEASALIRRRFEREFAPTVTDATRKFVYEGDGLLDLAPFDLRNLTTIRVDTEGASPTTLTTDQFRLYPRHKRDGVWTHARLSLPLGGSVFGEREVEVRGDWGFPVVPADVAGACIKTVAIWLRRDVAAFERTFSIEEDRLERPRSLPSAVESALGHYARSAP